MTDRRFQAIVWLGVMACGGAAPEEASSGAAIPVQAANMQMDRLQHNRSPSRIEGYRSDQDADYDDLEDFPPSPGYGEVEPPSGYVKIVRLSRAPASSDVAKGGSLIDGVYRLDSETQYVPIGLDDPNDCDYVKSTISVFRNGAYIRHSEICLGQKDGLDTNEGKLRVQEQELHIRYGNVPDLVRWPFTAEEGTLTTYTWWMIARSSNSGGDLGSDPNDENNRITSVRVYKRTDEIPSISPMLRSFSENDIAGSLDGAEMNL